MATAAKGAPSVLLGFSVCPLCGGKTHVKQKQEDGKRPYSHCLDEHDAGCSHTHYATNAAQARLMMDKTRPVKPLAGEATPTQAAPEVEAPSQASEPSHTPSQVQQTTTPPAKRRVGLWG